MLFSIVKLAHRLLSMSWQMSLSPIQTLTWTSFAKERGWWCWQTFYDGFLKMTKMVMMNKIVDNCFLSFSFFGACNIYFINKLEMIAFKLSFRSPSQSCSFSPLLSISLYFMFGFPSSRSFSSTNSSTCRRFSSLWRQNIQIASTASERASSLKEIK